jgi:hypothetical protein
MSVEPTPVEPLSYYDRTNDPWLPMIRLMSVLAIAHGGLSLLSFLCRLAITAWQWFAPTSAAISYGPAVGFDAIPALSAVMMMVGGILALRGQRDGRRVILIGSMIYIVAALIAFVVVQISYVYSGTFQRWGMPLSVSQSITTFFSALQRCLVPSLLWYFFRRPTVVELFHIQSAS